jgi:hypothetical protein
MDSLGYMKRRAEQSRVAALEAENWNLKYPVGTKVTLERDSGAHVETETRSEAYVCESGHAVCSFKGVSGYYLLNRATVRP